VKPETASQQHGDLRSGAAIVPSGIRDGATRPRLSEEQHRVLECLRKEGGGLTARQIQSRVGAAPAAVENALAVLLERQFVSRLNTLIPSYSYRVDGAPVDGT
jgi:hypothetical protein